MNEKIEVVLELDNGEPYAWDTVQLGKDDAGQYWWRAGSGCSCDWIDGYDWNPLNDRNQIYAAINDCGYRDHDHTISRADFRLKVIKELDGKKL